MPKQINDIVRILLIMLEYYLHFFFNFKIKLFMLEY